MNALRRVLLRVLHALQAIDPPSAVRFASDVEFFGSGLELLSWKLSDDRLRGRPLAVREGALAARVACEGLRSACRAVELAAAKLAPPPPERAPASSSSTSPASGPSDRGTSSPAPSPSDPATSSSAPGTSVVRRVVFEAEFEDESPRRGKRRGTDRQLELGVIPCGLLPARR